MYVSRHICLLGAGLVNLVLGLYLQLNPAWLAKNAATDRFVLIFPVRVSLLMALLQSRRVELRRSLAKIFSA